MAGHEKEVANRISAAGEVMRYALATDRELQALDPKSRRAITLRTVSRELHALVAKMEARREANSRAQERYRNNAERTAEGKAKARPLQPGPKRNRKRREGWHASSRGEAHVLLKKN